MATPTLFSLFDGIEIFRPQAGQSIRTDNSTVYRAPEGGQVQIRFDARALRVWLMDGQENYVLSLTVRNPRIIEISEDRVTIEGFEILRSEFFRGRPFPQRGQASSRGISPKALVK